MDPFQGTWVALCALALLLGARHGFDADHLATIDGLTRHNSRTDPRLARAAGALFSLGHGVVVLLVAFAAGYFSIAWHAPEWLEATGAAISVVLLFGLAYLNARAAWIADPRAIVAPTGLKCRLLGRILDVRGAWAIAGVGALFALSFDTISIAALLALSAGRFGGAGDCVLVAGLFVLGMLMVDGANGLWISRLVRKADRTAAVASRVMALGVAAISFAVGLFALVKVLIPAVQAWAEGRELALGGIVVVVVLSVFAVAIRAARRREPAATRHEPDMNLT